MKRGLAFLAALVLSLGLLSGCSGNGETNAAVSADMSTAETADTGGSPIYGGSEAEQMPQAPQTEAVEAGDRLQNAKMIYTANLSVETTAFDDASADLRQLVEGMGGYFETASVYNSGSYRSAYYTIRVPADHFQNLLTQVGKLCHVVRQEESSQNISEQYYDAESRLKTQQTKLERLQTLLSQAETMEDIITIESAISETELEIEQLTGTLRQYDSLVDYSTVNISLDEVYRLSNTEEVPQSFAGRMGSAFADGWNAFTKGVEDLAVMLAYSWIWVLLAAAAAIAAVRIVRKRRHSAAAGRQDEPGHDKPNHP